MRLPLVTLVVVTTATAIAAEELVRMRAEHHQGTNTKRDMIYAVSLDRSKAPPLDRVEVCRSCHARNIMCVVVEVELRVPGGSDIVEAYAYTEADTVCLM